MAENQNQKPKLSPLEELVREHTAAVEKRRKAIDAAMDEVREARKLLEETTKRVAGLQQENISASLAYDAKREELIAAAKSQAA